MIGRVLLIQREIEYLRVCFNLRPVIHLENVQCEFEGFEMTRVRQLFKGCYIIIRLECFIDTFSFIDEIKDKRFFFAALITI